MTDTELSGWTAEEAEESFTLGYIVNVAEQALGGDDEAFDKWRAEATASLLSLLVARGILLADRLEEDAK